MKNTNLIKKIHRYFIIFPIIVAIIGIVASTFFITYQKNLLEKIGTDALKQAELKVQKEKLKALVEHTIDTITFLQQQNHKNILQELKTIYKNKQNYIFIYKLNYPLNESIKHNKFATMVVNINRPNLLGKSIPLNYKDITNKEFRKEMLQKIIKNNETFVTYYYKNPLTNKIDKKLSYFKYYKPLNIIVASGSYLNEVDKIIKNYNNRIVSVTEDFVTIFMIVASFLLITIVFIYKIIVKSILQEIQKYQKTIKKETNKVKHQLYFDELTNLENRKLLVNKINKNLFDNLILIDIDDFKNINQFYSAETGDIYLKEFAKLLKKFKKTQTASISVFRIGSDEFVLGIRDSNYTKTAQIAKNLNLFIENQTIQIDNDNFDISVTIVFSKTPNPLKKALITLSIAKENHISLCSYDDIKDESKDKEYFEMRKLIKTAIEKNQITPYAQPIVNKDGKIIKYELLMRIVTENRVIPPYFLEYAKKAKLYNKLSLQMISKCFDFIEKTDVLCSINLDLEDIKNKKTIEKLEFYVDKVKKHVVFEILEYASMDDYSIFGEFVEKFRKKGVLFAIDDFGSGFSNYKEVTLLKPDYVKIDGSLIKDITKNKDNLLLVYSIVSLVATLNIKTTAEFVENEEIFNKLKSIGADEFQGYYFAKPTPLEELKDL